MGLDTGCFRLFEPAECPSIAAKVALMPPGFLWMEIYHKLGYPQGRPMVRTFEQNQPVILKPANQAEGDEARLSARPTPRVPSRFSAVVLSFAAVLSAFWVGVW